MSPVRGLLLVLGLVVGGAVAAGIAYVAVPRPSTSPFNDYGAIAPAEGEPLAVAIVGDLNRGSNAGLDGAVAFDALIGEAIKDIPLRPHERAIFIRNAVTSTKEHSIGAQLLRTGPKPVFRLVRMRERNGCSTALVRLLCEDGTMNFLELKLMRAPDSNIRIVDFHNYGSGESFSQSLGSIAVMMLAEEQRKPLQRLINGDGGQSSLIETMPRINELMAQGEHAKAMEEWNRLPEHVRTSRVGLFTRLKCAASLDGSAYVEAVEAIDSRYPDDPSLALVQIDAHYLRGDLDRTITCIRRCESALDGDGYLAFLRSAMELEAERAQEALIAAHEAIASEPDLAQSYDIALLAALQLRAHSQTSTILAWRRDRLHEKEQDFSHLDGWDDYCATTAAEPVEARD